MATGGDSPRARMRSCSAQALDLGAREHYEDPELYDVEYNERQADIVWYRALARRVAPTSAIVELGAGTGRVSLPLIRDGHRVIAVERMPAMITRLRARARDRGPETVAKLHVLRSEITRLDLPDASVDMVIAPFNVLMHLYTWRELYDCFVEVWRVLSPGGTFAFDVLCPDVEWLQWDCDLRHGVEPFTDPHTGELLIYSTNHVYDPATQICHIHIYYDRPCPEDLATGIDNDSAEAALERSTTIRTVYLAHRQIFPEEVRALLTIAGFEIERHTGDFAGRPLSSATETQSLVCRKLSRRPWSPQAVDLGEA